MKIKLDQYFLFRRPRLLIVYSTKVLVEQKNSDYPP